MYRERSQERYRERAVKPRVKGQVDWRYRLEKKPSWLKPPTLVEPEENEVYKEDLLIPAQVRRPVVRFSPQARSRLQSRRSAVCYPSSSVINELMKMGDPNVLEMVQEEERRASRGERFFEVSEDLNSRESSFLISEEPRAPDAQAQRPWLTGPAAPRHVGSSPTRVRTRVPRIDRRTLNHCTTREALGVTFQEE